MWNDRQFPTMFDESKQIKNLQFQKNTRDTFYNGNSGWAHVFQLTTASNIMILE